MLQKAKKKKYMVETLKPLNVLYDHELWLTLQDVDLSFSLTVFLKEIYTFVSKGTSMRNILYIITGNIISIFKIDPTTKSTMRNIARYGKTSTKQSLCLR